MLDNALLVRVGRQLAELDTENAAVRVQSIDAATQMLREAGIGWEDLIFVLELAVARGLADLLPELESEGASTYAVELDWRESKQGGHGRPGFWARRADGEIASVRQCRHVAGHPPSWTAAVSGKILCDEDHKPRFFPDKTTAKAAASRGW